MSATDWAPDARSAANIATLLPEVRAKAADFLHRLFLAGINAKIISGTRTWEEQDALYAKGRTTPGPRVTNARAGYSNHNFGIAFDIGIFEITKLPVRNDNGEITGYRDGSKYLEDSPLYAKAGAIGKEVGFDWGGDWNSIQDEPHFELRPPWAKDLSERDMITGLRTRQLQKRPLFA